MSQLSRNQIVQETSGVASTVKVKAFLKCCKDNGKGQMGYNDSSSLIYMSTFSSDNQIQISVMKPLQLPTIPLTITQIYLPPVSVPAPVPPATTAVSGGVEFVTKEKLKETPTGHLAMQLMSVALEGLTDEEPSDSGGEGMYRERDEFVIRNEDIETFKVRIMRNILSTLWDLLIES